MRSNGTLKYFPVSSSFLIENKKITFLISRSKILTIEGEGNLLKQLSNVNNPLHDILKAQKIACRKKSFILIDDKYKKNLIKLIESNHFKTSNELLLFYYLAKKKVSGKTKKLIWSSFSQSNPEYNYILKIAKHNFNTFFLSSKIKISQKKFRSTDSAIKKINISKLFLDTKDTLAKKYLFSPHGPLINYTKMKPLIKTKTRLRSYSISYRIPAINHSYMNATYNANGYDLSDNIALLKAAAEAHERFSSGYLDKEKVHYVKTQKLLQQDRIYRYLGISKQDYLHGKYICKPPKANLYPTIRGKVLNKRTTWNVPIDMVKFPYFPEKSNRFSFANSSGVAAGNNFTDACVRALLEYSERHFIAKHWLLQLPFRVISKNGLPLDIIEEMTALESSIPGKIIFCAMNCKALPHIVAMYIGTGKNWPAFHFCSAAHPNKKTALQKSLRELTNSLIFCPIFRKKVYLDEKDITSTKDHYNFYHNPDHFKTIYNKNLLNTKSIDWKYVPNLQSKNPGVLQKNLLHQLLDIFKNEFGEITAFDITAPETKHFGLTVARIITEKGLPMWFGHSDLPLHKAIIKKNKDTLRNDYQKIHPLG